MAGEQNPFGNGQSFWPPLGVDAGGRKCLHKTLFSVSGFFVFERIQQGFAAFLEGPCDYLMGKLAVPCVIAWLRQKIQPDDGRIDFR